MSNGVIATSRSGTTPLLAPTAGVPRIVSVLPKPVEMSLPPAIPGLSLLPANGTGAMNGVKIVTIGNSSNTLNHIPQDVQKRIHEQLAAPKSNLQLRNKNSDFMPLIEFPQASEEPDPAPYVFHEEADFDEIADKAEEFNEHNGILSDPSCLDNQDFASIRIGFRVVGIVGTGICQVLQQVGQDNNDSRLQWASTIGQLIIGILWGSSETVTVWKENKKARAEAARDVASKAIDKLLKKSEVSMKTKARELLRKWTDLTGACDKRDPFRGQLKNYIVANWENSLPRIRRIAQEKIPIPAKVDELLAPMSAAIRAIELDYSLEDTTDPVREAQLAQEFEKNPFFDTLERFQNEKERFQNEYNEQQAKALPDNRSSSLGTGNDGKDSTAGSKQKPSAERKSSVISNGGAKRFSLVARQGQPTVNKYAKLRADGRQARHLANKNAAAKKAVVAKKTR